MPTIDAAFAAEARRILEAKGIDPDAIGRHRLGEVLGIKKENQARRLLKFLRTPGRPPPQGGGAAPRKPAVEQTYGDNGNLWNIDLRGTRIETLDQFLEEFRVDLDAWEVKSFRVTRQEAFAMPRALGDDDSGWERKSGDPIVVPLNHIRVEFRRRVEVVDAKARIEVLVQMAEAHSPKIYKLSKTVKPAASGNLLEVSIFDAHVGAHAWGEETGYENNDINIASEYFRGAVDGLLERSQHIPWEHTLYVIGQDQLHIDNRENTTSRGTRQDADTRYQKAYRELMRCHIENIDKLLHVAPVTVMVVPGNHDYESTFHAGLALRFWYRNSEHVDVRDSPRSRKYFVWGDVFLMFAHGDKEARTLKRLKELPLLMATEEPERWGKSLWREVHLGHWHHERTDEIKGVKVRVLPSLCPPDAWHSESGFIGSHRQAEALWWHKHTGPLGGAIHSIRPYRELRD